jgi:hypothetical protein
MGDTPNSIFSDVATPVHISGGFFAAGGNNQNIVDARGPVAQWNVSGGHSALWNFLIPGRPNTNNVPQSSFLGIAGRADLLLPIPRAQMPANLQVLFQLRRPELLEVSKLKTGLPREAL